VERTTVVNGAGARPAGMTDVAALAGVSIQTVSRVVNGHRRVAPATRMRVEGAIAKLGYRPNPAAQALASRVGRTSSQVADNGQLCPTQMRGPGSDREEAAVRFSPTGNQFELRDGNGGLAVVTEVGGGLRKLSVGGRDLVAGFAPDEPRPVYRGSVLAPWPNRVGEGRYTWGRHEHSLALTEPDRGNALHGLVCWSPWTHVARHEASISLATRIWPQQGYPFQLDLTVMYRLHENGLFWQLDAHNSGREAAPYGCSVHPYLVAGAGRLDEWLLTVPADEYLEVDPERLLPVGLRAVDGSPFDFRSTVPLVGATVDHAFTGLKADGDGLARVVLRGSEGEGVALEWDPAILPWVQVHTADRPEPRLNRSGLAVEPMTCPPNALHTGDHLIRLEPGETHTAWWRIRAL
jgi:aldose 1-epimerase